MFPALLLLLLFTCFSCGWPESCDVSNLEMFSFFTGVVVGVVGVVVVGGVVVVVVVHMFLLRVAGELWGEPTAQVWLSGLRSM